MSVLTQREIDRLITGAEIGPEPPAEVMPFRFARPPRLALTRQLRVESVMNEFARALGETLTGRFRVLIETVVRGVEVVHSRDAVTALGAPCAAFRFEPRRGGGADALLDLGAELSLEMVERVFGGPGGATPERRALTSLEQGALTPVVERTLERLRSAWDGRLPVEPKVVDFTSEPQLLTASLGERDQLVAMIEVRFSGRSGFVTLALPFEEVSRALEEGGARPMPPADWLTAHVREAQVTLAARLPVVWLDARQVAGLAVGEVLELRLPADVTCELEVNGHVRFRGVPGQTAGRLALRITELDAVRRGGGPPRPGSGRRS